jgi:ABC-type uncharacterized transport system permease subunit
VVYSRLLFKLKFHLTFDIQALRFLNPRVKQLKRFPLRNFRNEAIAPLVGFDLAKRWRFAEKAD